MKLGCSKIKRLECLLFGVSFSLKYALLTDDKHSYAATVFCKEITSATKYMLVLLMWTY